MLKSPPLIPSPSSSSVSVDSAAIAKSASVGKASWYPDGPTKSTPDWRVANADFKNLAPVTNNDKESMQALIEHYHRTLVHPGQDVLRSILTKEDGQSLSQLGD